MKTIKSLINKLPQGTIVEFSLDGLYYGSGRVCGYVPAASKTKTMVILEIINKYDEHTHLKITHKFTHEAVLVNNISSIYDRSTNAYVKLKLRHS